MQINENKKSFFKFNILLKIKTSITIIKIINLDKRRDLIMGSYFMSPGWMKDHSYNNPGLKY